MTSKWVDPKILKARVFTKLKYYNWRQQVEAAKKRNTQRERDKRIADPNYGKEKYARWKEQSTIKQLNNDKLQSLCPLGWYIIS